MVMQRVHNDRVTSKSFTSKIEFELFQCWLDADLWPALNCGTKWRETDNISGNSLVGQSSPCGQLSGHSVTLVTQDTTHITGREY